MQTERKRSASGKWRGLNDVAKGLVGTKEAGGEIRRAGSRRSGWKVLLMRLATPADGPRCDGLRSA